MAVQKSKKTRSRRDMRRTQNSRMTVPSLGVDSYTGETHRRHHITESGYYRGKQVLLPRVKKDDNDEANA